VEIREALPEDFGSVREVARQGWAFAYDGIIPSEAQREFLTQAYSAASLQERLGRGAFLVAVLNDDDGVVDGFADFRPLGSGVELAALYVLPGAHGRGVGSRLLEEGLARFPFAGDCVLRVVRENEGARRFYEARGFRAAGEAAWRFGERDLTELEMVRAIG
jgi:ribosomal protein S18 acetylase RimI-like enzyme